MSSKNFSGTLTVGLNTFDVTATLAKRGLRVAGHIVFTSNTELAVPLNLIIDNLGTSFTTPASTWFADPLGNTVELLNLTIAETTIDGAFTELNIAAADCAINGVVSTLSMDLDEVAVIANNGAVEDPAEAVGSVTRKLIQPIRINEVGNSSDHFGGLLSLARISGEKNEDYIKRIRDVIARPSGAHYGGLINGVNRELGLEQEDAIRVTMIDPPSGDESKIRFYLDEKECIIYDKWVPIDRQQSGITPTVEIQTDIKEMTVGKLVDFINTSSNYRAELLGAASSRATNLLVTDSRVQVQESIVGQNIMELAADNIVPGSLTLQPLEEMESELDINSVMSTKGQFQVNYSAGIVKAYTAAPTTVEFTYTSNRKSFLLVWSPIRIIDFTSEGSQNLFFSQVAREFYTSELNHYVNGLPTNEAYGIMRDILTAGKFPQFWGE